MEIIEFAPSVCQADQQSDLTAFNERLEAGIAVDSTPRLTQIVNHLHEAETLLSQGRTVGEICRRIGVLEQSFYLY